MKIRIIKGTKQIGGCITEICSKNSRIIIDFGEDLEESVESFELEGLTFGASKYDAVFITHSHADHIGLINKINKEIPVYVEEESLNIHNLSCDFCGKKRVDRKVSTFKVADFQKRKEANRCIFDNGVIKVSAYSTDHSSYNSCMFLIEADGKRVLHTGDFRNHGRRKLVFERALNTISKVDMLITEGTALTRYTKDECHFLTEKELERKAYNIMDKYNQVFVLESSTNIDRTVSFGRCALMNDKKFVLDLFSYYINETSTHYFDVDYKKIYVWRPLRYNKKPFWFRNKYLDIKTSSKIFPNFSMIVKESMLDDIKLMYDKGLLTNACLIYSMWDGYLENESLKNFINEISKMNIKIEKLHTSGHADIRGMKMVNNRLNPDKTIIIHTLDNSNGKKIFNNVLDVKDNQYIEV